MKKENSIDVMAIEHDLNPQIYGHLNSIIKLDINGNLITYNQAFTKQYGYTEQNFNKPFLDVFIKDEKLEHKHYFEHAILGQEQSFDAIALCKNGKEVEINVTLIPINTKIVKDVFVIVKNIAKSKKLQKEMLLFQKKQHIFNELENICDFYYDAINDLHYYSNQFPLIFGIDEGQKSSPTLNNLLQYVYFDDRPTVNNTIQDAIRNRTGYQLEYRLLRKDQTFRYVFEQAEILLDQTGQLDGFIGFIQDITKRKKAEDLNKYLAYHDPLTDLPNRRLFQDKLEQTLEISKTLQQKLAVILLDLDRFKYINDTLGHPVGDKFLQQISARLSKILRDQDVLARFGGDEFAFLLPNIVNTTEAIEYSKTIIKLLEEAFHIENYELFITASIGISIFPIDGEETDTLIKHADSALYRAKDKGKNTYQIYTPSMDIESYKIFSLESDLRKALELNQFELYYQPKICATDNQIIGAEALIRWNHPQWGIVSPGEFIPLAEETGIILEIDKWIKFTTCTQIYAWQKAGLPVVPISINLSAHRFLEKDLLIHLKEILTQTMLDPKYLEIEITETSF